MGSRYLVDLADVCRRAGLVVQEEGGWQSRGRGSGGYSGDRPNHVMVHHTASGPQADGQPDVSYMTYHANARPIANLYLSRSGKVWVMAAGSTNTNGTGTCPHCGHRDAMNSAAIGIEAGNNGTGEPWPNGQQDAYVRLVSALCAHYSIPTAAVIAHHEYAPSRKVDPAGPSRWSSPTGPVRWRMDEFRASLGGAPPPTPLPTTEDDEMAVAITAPDDPGHMTFAWNGVGINWITSNDQLAVGLITGVLKFDSEGNPLRNFDKAAIQDLIDRCWAGVPGSQFPPGYRPPA